MNERSELMHTIRKYDFALYDLMLYLDTHPDCTEARELFTEYREKRERAVNAFVQRFGPMQSLQTDTAQRWTWGAGPYPWEKEAN